MNSTLSLTNNSDKVKNAKSNSLLNGAAVSWFVVAVVGQWIFALYVAIFYGSSAVVGDFAAWNQVLPHGHVPGETMGNLAVAAHLFLAVAIMVGGPLQIIPQVRSLFPRFHRLNGRLYVTLAIVISLTGIYMILTRGTVGGVIGQVSVSVNALLIMLCAILAWRFAVARDFNRHRRWVLRLFLVVNGVWFFRVGLMFWLFINQRPVGFDPETFQGPFLTFLGFAQYLLPLAVLQLYFYAQEKAGKRGRLAVASTLILLTMAMGLGIFAATMGMWLPRLG